MLSDTCFELIHELLEGVVNYDYSDDYRHNIIFVIMILNNIKDELDKCEGNLLKDNKELSIRIATKLYLNAVKKRPMSSVDFYDDIYD